MSNNGTSKVVRYSSDKLPPDNTDWARVNAMTGEEVMAAALSDPDAQPLTPEQLAKMRRVSRVKVLRQRLGMTRTEFAEAFRLPIATLLDWEQHRSIPDAPARALLLATTARRDRGVAATVCQVAPGAPAARVGAADMSSGNEQRHYCRYSRYAVLYCPCNTNGTMAKPP
jgi:putative transcriptional regulator